MDEKGQAARTVYKLVETEGPLSSGERSLPLHYQKAHDSQCPALISNRLLASCAPDNVRVR